MIKLIIFDLDGVLVDAKKIHYETLNTALGDVDRNYVITWDEHISLYDGLKTRQKLEILHDKKGLPISVFDKIWEKKQNLTQERLSSIEPSKSIIDCLTQLVKDKYKIACCSNSVRKTITTVLEKLNIINYFDLILSNEDVDSSKPHPEIYWKAISKMCFLPEETLIIEDSPHGLLSATRSGSNIFRVSSSEDVNYFNIKKEIDYLDSKNKILKHTWSDDKLNIVIPMAGAGSRFEKMGYSNPKPLIDVNGKPMVQVVVENLNIDANYIYVAQHSHVEKYNLETILRMITPNCKIIRVSGLTEGSVCTALLSKEIINNDNPLLIVNSDQFIDWNSSEFMYRINETDCDGAILTFNSTQPQWSFVKVDEFDYVTEVAEKKPISNIATVGIYFWKKGSDFVKFSEQMISKNIKVNNEFYICPVFNEALLDSKKIKRFQVNKMWGLGTPEDLNIFLYGNKNNN